MSVKEFRSSFEAVNSFSPLGMADTSQFTFSPVSFDVGLLGFPELLKMIVGAIMVVLFGLAALVWSVLRPIRWRKSIYVAPGSSLSARPGGA